MNLNIDLDVAQMLDLAAPHRKGFSLKGFD